ncbi:MAG: amidohydrolase [Thermoplasmata archaeon YP2-bin.285]|uniref:Amidohydrolase n=1 Tax=Candidatus Sysuiplasma superficiale TaxID=2823368 RepID=A0A8J7YHS2_9ARCH|nr:amidohydrolase [Candidatus Sysuiplasma superficiale]
MGSNVKAIVVHNANIFTGRGHAGAMLISEGRVMAIGDEEEILSAAEGIACEKIDAGGNVVLPGLIDSHMHLLETGTEMLMGSLRDYRSIAALVKSLKERCSDLPFLISGGWDEENFEERRLPDREDLDKISTDRPVMLFRFCHHVVSVNSFVMERTGIERAGEVSGGIIGRDSSGRPNGILYDRAIDHILDYRKQLISGIAEQAVEMAARYAASKGITTLMPLDADDLEFRKCREMVSSGRIPCRIRMFLSHDTFMDYLKVPPAVENDFFRVSGVKIFADGSFGGRTALLSEPYADSGTAGLQLAGVEEMSAAMSAAVSAGKIVAVHAIGDRAIINTLNAASLSGIPSHLLRIEHVALTPPAVVEALSAFRPHLVVQPHFLVGDWWLQRRLGSRAEQCYLFRTFLRKGMEPAGSSDSPVEPLDPWTGILAAVDRGRHAASPMADLAPSERLSPEEALKMYTTWAGKSTNEEGRLGTLEEGSYADFVIMEEKSVDNLIQNSRVLMTFVAGSRIYP